MDIHKVVVGTKGTHLSKSKLIDNILKTENSLDRLLSLPVCNTKSKRKLEKILDEKQSLSKAQKKKKKKYEKTLEKKLKTEKFKGIYSDDDDLSVTSLSSMEEPDGSPLKSSPTKHSIESLAEELRIDFNFLKPGKNLGQGAFGMVKTYHYLWQACNETVAVKELAPLDDIEKTHELFVNEINILRSVQRCSIYSLNEGESVTQDC